jgi:uncharacterized membrane protein YfcA
MFTIESDVLRLIFWVFVTVVCFKFYLDLRRERKEDEKRRKGEE